MVQRVKSAKKLISNRSLWIDSWRISNIMISLFLFCLYILFTVSVTNDEDIFMLEKIKIPLLDIGLPFVSFYSVMPLLLFLLQLELLRLIHEYRRALLDIYLNYKNKIEIIPAGPYEKILLNFKNNLIYKTTKTIFYIVILYIPIFTSTILYLGFGRYQNFGISSWHLVLIFLSILTISLFGNIFEFTKDRDRGSLLLKFLSILCSICILSLYHYEILYTINKSDFSKDDIKFFSKLHSEVQDFIPALDEILLPTIEIDCNSLTFTGRFLLQTKDKETKIFSNRSFRLAKFSECDFAKLYFENSRFDGSDLSLSNLKRAHLAKASLQGADLGVVDLQNADLSYANLKYCDLFGAKLEGSNLVGAKLEGARLCNSDLSNANLNGSDLKIADLKYSNLHSANLQNANLQAANLWFANLSNSKLEGCKLQGALLYGSNFKKIENLDKIDKKRLKRAEAKELIDRVKKYKYMPLRFNNHHFKKIMIDNIAKAIDRDPLIWLKEQNAVFDESSEEKIKKLCELADSEEARSTLGCKK